MIIFFQFFILFIVSFATSFIYAQSPAILWQKCLGGSGRDRALSISQTIDGGFIVAGATGVTDIDSIIGSNTSNFHRGLDIWIVKINQIGAIEWEKCFGGSGDEVATSIIQTSDRGYVFTGNTNSTDGDVTGLHGRVNVWIVKIDEIGNIQWQKCLGGTDKDYANAIIQTSDGGFAVATDAHSVDGDVVGKHKTTYNSDAWIIKLSDSGNIDWSMCYGGTGDEKASSILQTLDQGYIFTGVTSSLNGDVSGKHGGQDLWVVKINKTGILEWQKCYGGSGEDWGQSITATSNGGFAIAGATQTINDGDVSGNHTHSGSNDNEDGWVIKIDSAGVLEWEKCLGSSARDELQSIIQTKDGGYATSGFTWSNDYPENVFFHGNVDCYVVKLNSLGNIDWQKCLGGTLDDYAYSIIETKNDNALVITGYARSIDDDVFGHTINDNDYDMWVIKLVAPSKVNDFLLYGNSVLQNYPNPLTGANSFFSIIPFETDVVGMAEFEFTDITGKSILKQEQSIPNAGRYYFDLKANNLPAGTYFYRIKMQSGEILVGNKIILLK
jgi:hypothetical protein